MHKEDHDSRFHPHLPHIGQRMIKTGIAVFICLLIYRLLGFEGENMPVEASITTIICMQPFVKGSREFALNRFSGTMIGAAWGVLLFLLLYAFPVLGQNMFILYGLMGLGVLLSLYTAVALKMPEVSSLSAIIFMCFVASFPYVESPLPLIGLRLLGVLIGTVVAIAVNLVRLPRRKNKDVTIFVRSKDLIPDRFSQVPPSVLFHLNRLYEEGAKICLISEHAPAMFTMQMSNCHVSVPLIVMDGAAIYDINENQYLYVKRLEKAASIYLQSWFLENGYSYYTYIIRKNRTWIYHNGPIHKEEEEIYNRLRKSPYRSYLDDGNIRPQEVVYFKVIANDEKLENLRESLDPLLPKYGLRAVIRNQSKSPEINALYIYSAAATPERTQKRLMKMLRKENPNCYPENIFLKHGYRSDHDVSVLIHRITAAYEPVIFSRRKRSCKKTKNRDGAGD